MITISAIRKKAGITQEELSKRLHISQQAISQYELGYREPDLETLCKMADIFEVSVDYLLGRVDEDHTKVVEKQTPLPEEDQKLLDIFHKCPPELREYIIFKVGVISYEGLPEQQNTATEEAATREEGKLLA